MPHVYRRPRNGHPVAPGFRPDVQGLRGVAVVLVILYHVGFPVKGGFVGVDVFFVISGFVITRLIVAEVVSSKRFSFTRFYARRISRLVPLYAVVTASVMIVAHFALSPFGEVQDVVKTGVWSAGFAANFQLLLENSYVGLEANPLRHLWSLAVEEQFYVFFPAVLVALVKWRFRGIRGEERANMIFGGLLLASFLLCAYWSHFGSEFLQRASFFIAPTRAWQFLAGAGTALYLEKLINQKSRSLSFVAITSVVGLIWSSLVITEDAPFPGLWAVLPTLAAVGILCSSQPGSAIHRMLSLSPLRVIGELSYGLYLWHWPIVVFVVRRTSLTPGIAILIVFVSLLLAGLSYLAVEKPIREGFRVPQRALFVLGASLFVTLGVAILVGRDAGRTYSRAVSPGVPADAQMVRFGLGARDTRLNLVNTCNDPSASITDLQKDCSNHLNDGVNRVLILGDSHAAAIGDGLFMAGTQLGVEVIGYFEYGCPIIDGYTVQRIEDCEKSIQRSLELVGKLKPDVVVLAQSYTAYATFEQEATTVIDPDMDVPVPATTSARISHLITDATVRIRQLVEFGTRVVVVREVPFAVMPGTDTAMEFKAHSRLLSLINQELDRKVMWIGNVLLLDLTDYICPVDPPCALDSDGRLLYWHKTHLNRRGSERLVPVWTKLLMSQLQVDK